MTDTPKSTTAPDPFDLESIRLDPSAASSAGVEKILRSIPVRKPQKHDYVRVHPAPEFRAPAAVIELRESLDNEIYLLNAEMAAQLPSEYHSVNLHAAINRQGVLFLWPVRLPDASGRRNEWSNSAAEAAAMAMNRWIRVGAYEIFAAIGSLTPPVWPPITFQEMLRIAFRDRFVTDLSHPLVKRLHGAE
jgi:hypothetical protein